MESNNILISVVIPIYNAEKFVADTLESLRKQTLINIEVICVDDGSTDNTAKIIKDFSTKDKRFKYLHKINGGAGSARNIGILASCGEYIAFLDIDDQFSTNNTLELLYTKAHQSGMDICGGLYSNSGNKKQDFAREQIVDFKEFQNDFFFTRYLYKREFLLKYSIFFPEYRCYEDPVFLLKAMSIAKKFYSISDEVYKYSGSHQCQNMNLDKTKDYLRGITDELMLSSMNHYTIIHKKAFSLLNNEVSYYCEKELRSNDKELFILLLKANGAVDRNLISVSDFEISPVLLTIWCTSQKYLKIRNSKIVQMFLKIRSKK
ncbi:MAG: glycosyltransferase family 2 protein [Lachnospiraceae bacterium]|nr:glycosyltransferase family 2 protein [Lachnospiraceae bacterium]